MTIGRSAHVGRTFLSGRVSNFVAGSETRDSTMGKTSKAITDTRMWAAAVIALIVAVAAVLIVWLLNNQRTDFTTIYVDKDKSVGIIVLRDMSNVYPVFASQFKAEFDLTKKGQKETEKSVAGTVAETKVRRLYQQLDQIDADLRLALSTHYVKYVTAMSAAATAQERADASRQFEQAVDAAIRMAGDIRKLHQEIEKAQVVTSAADWEVAEATVEKMDEAMRPIRASLKK
jgi:hypothetical protein